MANDIRHQDVYLATGDPDTLNEASLYKAGELGAVLARNNRRHQVVQCDTGATSATSVGVVAATQVAYWKDKVNYLVTNDSAQAIGGSAAANNFRNSVAGIFRAAVTAGRYCAVLQAGDQINVLAAAGTYVAGELAVANSGTSADITRIAVGTAPGYVTIGLIRGARAGGVVPVDVDLPSAE